MSEALEVARIEIVRVVENGELVDYAEAVDTGGAVLPLTEILGMLRLAEDTFIRMAMGEDDDDALP